MFKVVPADSHSMMTTYVKDSKKGSFKIAISDKAHNTLTLQIGKKLNGTAANLVIESLRYNDSPPVSLKQTSFSAVLKKVFNQIFKSENKLSIELSYDWKKDTTFLTRKQNNRIIETKTLKGMKKLVLQTMEGKINYIIK
jgi:hypothetical protein